MDEKRVLIVIPTYNPGSSWDRLVKSLFCQDVNNIKLVVIDSDSQDGSLTNCKNISMLKEKFEFVFERISKSEFNHGGTRMQVVTKYGAGCSICIFLTQDIELFSESSLSNLLRIFDEDQECGAAYGRQIPHLDANPLARYSRKYNYKECSYRTTFKSKEKYGIKTVFLSNSFAAYNINALLEVGGFPNNTILCEDMYVAAKLVLAGYSINYCADSVARHSHNYTVYQEFSRYFDIGVFHSKESWIQEKISKISGEGICYALNELRYASKYGVVWVVKSVLNSCAKFIGIKLGHISKYLPIKINKQLSMHKGYWE